jgi:hypothetical protein
MADLAIALTLLEIFAKLQSAEKGVEAAKNSGKEAAKINAVSNLVATVINNIGAHVRQLEKQKHDIAFAKINQGYHEKNVAQELKNFEIKQKINRIHEIETNKIRHKFSDQIKIYALPSLVETFATNYNHEEAKLVVIFPPECIEIDNASTKKCLTRRLRDHASKHTNLIHIEEIGISPNVRIAAAARYIHDTLRQVPSVMLSVEDNNNQVDVFLYCWFMSDELTAVPLASIPKSDYSEEICSFTLMLALSVVTDTYYLYKFNQAPTLLNSLSAEVVSTKNFQEKNLQALIAKLLIEVYIPMICDASPSPAKLQGLLDCTQLAFVFGEDELAYALMSKVILARGGEAPIRDRDSLKILAKELDLKDAIKLRKYLILSDRQELARDIDACFPMELIVGNNFSKGRSLI